MLWVTSRFGTHRWFISLVYSRNPGDWYGHGCLCALHGLCQRQNSSQPGICRYIQLGSLKTDAIEKENTHDPRGCLQHVFLKKWKVHTSWRLASKRNDIKTRTCASLRNVHVSPRRRSSDPVDPASWLLSFQMMLIWGGPSMEVPQHGWFILGNPIKMDETSISTMSKIYFLQQCALNLDSTFQVFISSVSPYICQMPGLLRVVHGHHRSPATPPRFQLKVSSFWTRQGAWWTSKQFMGKKLKRLGRRTIFEGKCQCQNLRVWSRRIEPRGTSLYCLSRILSHSAPFRRFWTIMFFFGKIQGALGYSMYHNSPKIVEQHQGSEQRNLVCLDAPETIGNQSLLFAR